MTLSHFPRTAWQTLRAAFGHLGARDPLRMAGATAFFATFGIPAVLIIVVRTLGLFLGRRNVGQRLAEVMQTILGTESVEAIRKAIQSFREMQSGPLLTVGVFLFLLFVATTLFKIIRRSINDIWSIRGRRTAKLSRLLRSRAQALAVMLLGGLLFLAVHLIDTVQREYLARTLPEAAPLPGRALNIAVVMVVSTVWFYALYRYLPDGRPARKATLGGALITSGLFSVGKIMLRALLDPESVNDFYGASGAVVLVLLFVFYSSLLIYFGAALIRAWSETLGKPVTPKAHAVRYTVVDVD